MEQEPLWWVLAPVPEKTARGTVPALAAGLGMTQGLWWGPVKASVPLLWWVTAPGPAQTQ